MYWAINQIFNPVKYLKIEQGSSFWRSKRVYDWILPILLSGVTTFSIYIFRDNIILLGDDGLVVRFLSLIELLIAFFIAALAAVATFNREGLDDIMKGEPAIIILRKSDTGDLIEHPLSRRQFVCFLFGYLCFSAICMFILINFSRYVPFRHIFENLGSPMYVFLIFKYVIVFIFFVFLWQIICAMFLGIYFLSDRMQFMKDRDL